MDYVGDLNEFFQEFQKTLLEKGYKSIKAAKPISQSHLRGERAATMSVIVENKRGLTYTFKLTASTVSAFPNISLFNAPTLDNSALINLRISGNEVAINLSTSGNSVLAIKADNRTGYFRYNSFNPSPDMNHTEARAKGGQIIAATECLDERTKLAIG
ncbi:MAG: hypothetical protein DHS20C02_04700 [Micavibrio sp.]|nr:MAG: hypothetical protein DHS20C02_04700 [Micavibrio sp.]